MYTCVCIYTYTYAIYNTKGKDIVRNSENVQDMFVEKYAG